MKYRMFGRGAMWGRGCSRNTCAPVTVEEAAAVVGGLAEGGWVAAAGVAAADLEEVGSARRCLRQPLQC